MVIPMRDFYVLDCCLWMFMCMYMLQSLIMVGFSFMERKLSDESTPIKLVSANGLTFNLNWALVLSMPMVDNAYRSFNS